jgi:hypothetical protein
LPTDFRSSSVFDTGHSVYVTHRCIAAKYEVNTAKYDIAYALILPYFERVNAVFAAMQKTHISRAWQPLARL